jgi:hypothetical protein
MANSNPAQAPIVTEADQPDNFDEILTQISVELHRLGLSWECERTQKYVLALLATRGYTPASYESARYALSYSLLKIFYRKLTQQRKNATTPLDKPTPNLGKQLATPQN